MARPKQGTNLWGSLKDKLSVLKATALLLSRHHTATHTTRLAVLKATTHDPSTSPPPHFISDLLLLSHHSSASHAASDALLSRLRKTHDAFVALKCLLSLHHLLPSLSSYSDDTNKLLHLSNFRDQSNHDAWQLSLWVRWFAQEIQNTLSLSSLLGFPFSSSDSNTLLTDQDPEKKQKKISGLSDSGLLRELGALVSMVEQLGSAPDSLQYQTIDLVYEAMKLAGEDYRIAMREIFARIREVEDGGRLETLSEEGLRELIGLLERLEGCKDKMLLMFLNKKRNDGVWDAIQEAKAKADEEKRRRDDSKMVAVAAERREWATFTAGESTSRPRGGRWLDVDWNKALTISTA